MPLSVSCWPNISKNGMSVSMQYELKNESVRLQDVVIAIPLPEGEKPKIEQVEQGTTRVDARAGQLLWTIEVIDESNSSGSLDFFLPSKDENPLFPIQVGFSATNSLCGIQITEISGADSAPVKFSLDVNVSANEFVVLNE